MEALLGKLVTALGELRLGLTDDCERTLEDAIAVFLTGRAHDLPEQLRRQLLATIIDQRENAEWQS